MIKSEMFTYLGMSRDNVSPFHFPKNSVSVLIGNLCYRPLTSFLKTNCIIIFDTSELIFKDRLQMLKRNVIRRE